MTFPTFIIGGERRSGTTSLYHWMKAHPEVYLYPKADMDYFIEEEIASTRQWRDGEADGDLWERTHSAEAYARLFEGATGFRAVGQKDADLLFWRPSHERMRRFLPDVRFVFILRDPIKRAWSHYWNEVSKGREPLSFEEALREEDARCRNSAYARLHLSYLRRGYYDESLEAFYQVIDPSRVLVTTLEEALSRPAETLKQIYDFIGVDTGKGYELAGQRFNENPVLTLRPWADTPIVRPLERVYSRITEGIIVRLWTDREQRTRLRKHADKPFRFSATAAPIPDRVRRELAAQYAPHIDRLEKILGRPFARWKPRAA